MKDQKLDAIIVFGKSLHQDGSPDFVLRSRVEKALEVLNAHPQAKLIITGGKSHWLAGKEQISEAQAMLEYAKQVQPDLHLDQVIVEDQGNSTIHQLAKIKVEQLLPNSWKNVGLVTDEIHMPRAASIALGVLGDEFIISQYPAKVDLAGAWRALIEEKEKRDYDITYQTRNQHIKNGDHETWLRETEKFQERARELRKQGVTSEELLQSIHDELQQVIKGSK
jgi:uncharacterized SAM-binding protein YcdF (DUF218 family)